MWMNVCVWGFRYIRVIRDIRVPLNYAHGVFGGRVWFLNTDYTNGTNVDAWRFRYIRVIRDIRVPLNCAHGVVG